MKIRNGFVSNSSSSSFLIVGVAGWLRANYDNRLAELAKRDHCDPENGFGGYSNGKTLVFVGHNYEEGVSNFRPDYVGIEIADAFRSGKTFVELKQEFLKAADELGINFKKDEIDLYFGESTSE